MAVSFKVPKSPAKSVIQIENFLGADFTNSAANMDTGKSPNCINMIRDVPGKVRKCMGYETVDFFISSFSLYNNDEYTDDVYMDNPGFGDIEEEKLAPDADDARQITYTCHTVEQGTQSVKIQLNFSPPAFLQQGYKYVYDSNVYSSPSGTEGDRIINKEYIVYDEISVENVDSYDFIIRQLSNGYVFVISITATNEEAEPGDFELSFLFQSVAIGSEQPRVNGFHKLRNDDYGLLHVGTYMYRNQVPLYSVANDARSKSWEFDEHLYILDGKKMLRYGISKPESDTRFRASKEYNDVVVDEDVSLTIRGFSKKQYKISITSKSTTSPNGKFTISKDKKSIIYSDKLTEVDQDVTYVCTFKYKTTSSASWKTGSISAHHLLGISGEGDYEVVPVEDDAYIPLVTIAKNPSGGGTPHEDLNLLTPWFREQYFGDGTSKVYHTSFKDWNETPPIVEILNESTGEWVEQAENTYSVNYAEGTVTFGSAPPAPTGSEDNVAITACRTVERYKDRINHCTIGILYGVNGAQDRLFVSGNPDYKNYDWYSKDDDPTYFADTAYSYLGTSASAIIGYSIISNYLAAHKDKYERDQNIVLREGDMIDSEPSFRIINTLQGAGAVAPYSFAYLSTEPVFLTEQGVYAVTAQDITGEKYAQDRSFFLNGALLKEENLKDAYACVYNDMYWLCLNGKAYILDGLQSMRTDRSEPYATRQYAGFYRENLPARVMWEDNGRLFFGTDDGKVCRFYNDKYANASYNDNGEPIVASWETPDINGQVFFKNKTLRHIAVKLDSSIATSIKIYVLDRGLYNFVKEDDTIRELWEHVSTDTTSALYLSFANVIFSRFSFSTDQTQHTLPTKVRVKKVDKFRVKLVNDALNEPFGLFNLGFEYIERNNYKG